MVMPVPSMLKTPENVVVKSKKERERRRVIYKTKGVSKEASETKKD